MSTKIGNVKITLGQPSTGTFRVTLTDVYYAPNVSYNIVLLYKPQEQKALDILFTKQDLRLTVADSVKHSSAYNLQNFKQENIYGIHGNKIYKLEERDHDDHAILLFGYKSF